MCNNEVGMNRYKRVYGIQNNGWIQLDMVPVLIVYEWFRNLDQVGALCLDVVFFFFLIQSHLSATLFPYTFQAKMIMIY